MKDLRAVAEELDAYLIPVGDYIPTKKKCIDAIEVALLQAREEGITAAAEIASTEDVPVADLAPIEIAHASPILAAVASVIATKKYIEGRILNLLSRKPS